MARCCASLQHACTVLLFVQLAAVATAQRPPRIAPQQNPSVTMDLSNGGSFKFNISPDVPPFTFKIIPDPQEADRYGNARSTVRSIEVFQGDSAQPVQELTGCDLTVMEPPPRNETDPPWFHAEDINFDGYKDIFLLTNWGVTGNQSGCVWLYDRATGRFDYSKEFSELPRHWLDQATKTILTFGTGGMAGAIHSAERYKVENGHLLLIYSERQDWDEDKKQFHCIARERRGAGMATVADEWDAEAVKACDGSKAAIPRVGPVKVDGDIQAQKLISQVAPTYPAEARQIVGIERTVVFHALIDKEGHPTRLLISLADGPVPFPPLIKAAMDAVRQWRYAPTLVDGDPVEVETTITVTFPPGG